MITPTKKLPVLRQVRAIKMCIRDRDINGWFIGYVETSDNSYYFATNIQSDSNATGKKAFEITSDILKKLHIWN